MSDPVNPETLKEGRKVLLALPFYKTASPLTMFSLLAMMDRSKIAVSLGFGDAFVAHSRNKLATQLVNSDLEWTLHVDDDSVLPFGDAKWFNDNTGLKLDPKFAGMNTINRLLSHGKTLVGGLYFGRWRAGSPVFAEGKEMEKLLRSRGPIDEIRPTRWVGTGSCLFHRSVFLDIENAFPHLSRASNNGTGQYFTSSEHDLFHAVTEAEKIFADPALTAEEKISRVEKELRNGKAKARANSVPGVGEDVQLCHRAAQCGHQPFVDLGLWIGHVGNIVYPLR